MPNCRISRERAKRESAINFRPASGKRARVQCARVRNRGGKLGTGGQSDETDAWLPCRGRSGVFLFGIRRDSSRDEAHACAARPTATPDVASSATSFSPLRPSPRFPPSPSRVPTTIFPQEHRRGPATPSCCCFFVSSVDSMPTTATTTMFPFLFEGTASSRCSSSKAIGKTDRRKKGKSRK